MALVSMKTSDSDSMCCSSSPYGWGTLINLNEEQCKALGITEPLRAGMKLNLVAVAFVRSSSESVEDDGDSQENDISMCLQITEMELSPAVESKKSAAQALYSKDE
jgi:hypothetical protein